MKAQEIYDLLRAGGLSRAGALGMLGNMQAESGLKEDIAQRGMTTLSDEQYTAAADSGSVNFSGDAVGYGLCQWTYHTRKKALLEKAKSYACSVGDGTMQVEFCLDELIQNYNVLYIFLCNSDSIDECSDRICKEFEQPAINNFLTRRSFPHSFENQVFDTGEKQKKEVFDKVFPKDATVLAFQLWLNYNGYPVEANGYKSPEFFKTLRQFVDDMEGC